MIFDRLHSCNISGEIRFTIVKGVKKAYDRLSTEVEPTKDMGGALSHVTKAAVQGVGLVRV